jgi:hypothetical protein
VKINSERAIAHFTCKSLGFRIRNERLGKNSKSITLYQQTFDETFLKIFFREELPSIMPLFSHSVRVLNLRIRLRPVDLKIALDAMLYF